MSLRKPKRLASAQSGPTRSDAQAVASSLPPTLAGAAPGSSLLTPKKPRAQRNLRKRAIEIVGLKSVGMSTTEIAERMKIAPHTIENILWEASRSGLLEDKHGNFLLTDPVDEVKYSIQHKAVKNLHALLDSNETLSKGERSVKMETTLDVFKHTLAKKFDTPKTDVAQTMNVLAIKVEIPEGVPVATVRPGAIGGVPASFIEGETNERPKRLRGRSSREE